MVRSRRRSASGEDEQTLVRPWRLPLGEDSLTQLLETLRVACFPVGVRYRLGLKPIWRRVYVPEGETPIANVNWRFKWL